jgi:hypothetical protein
MRFHPYPLMFWRVRFSPLLSKTGHSRPLISQTRAFSLPRLFSWLFSGRFSPPLHLHDAASRGRERRRASGGAGGVAAMDRHGRPRGQRSSPMPWLWLDLAATMRNSTNSSSPPGCITPGEHKAKGATSAPSSKPEERLEARGRGR